MDNDGRIGFSVGDVTKAIVDSRGEVFSLSKSRDYNERDAAEIAELINAKEDPR